MTRKARKADKEKRKQRNSSLGNDDKPDPQPQPLGDGLDGSMEMCLVCQQESEDEAFCCDCCPRIYHDSCLKQLEALGPIDGEPYWKCPGCLKEEQEDQLGSMPVLKDDPMAMCLQAFEILTHHELCYPFLEPVDPSITDYYEEIERPMDFSMIGRNIKSGLYDEKLKDEAALAGINTAVVAFCKDVRQIWYNCRLFNLEGSAMYRMGTGLSKLFELFVEQKLIEATNVQTIMELSKNRAEFLHLENPKTNTAFRPLPVPVAIQDLPIESKEDKAIPKEPVDHLKGEEEAEVHTVDEAKELEDKSSDSDDSEYQDAEFLLESEDFDSMRNGRKSQMQLRRNARQQKNKDKQADENAETESDEEAHNTGEKEESSLTTGAKEESSLSTGKKEENSLTAAPLPSEKVMESDTPTPAKKPRKRRQIQWLREKEKEAQQTEDDNQMWTRILKEKETQQTEDGVQEKLELVVISDTNEDLNSHSANENEASSLVSGFDGELFDKQESEEITITVLDDEEGIQPPMVCETGLHHNEASDIADMEVEVIELDSPASTMNLVTGHSSDEATKRDIGVTEDKKEVIASPSCPAKEESMTSTLGNRCSYPENVSQTNAFTSQEMISSSDKKGLEQPSNPTFVSPIRTKIEAQEPARSEKKEGTPGTLGTRKRCSKTLSPSPSQRNTPNAESGVVNRHADAAQKLEMNGDDRPTGSRKNELLPDLAQGKAVAEGKEETPAKIGTRKRCAKSLSPAPCKKGEDGAATENAEAAQKLDMSENDLQSIPWKPEPLTVLPQVGNYIKVLYDEEWWYGTV